MKWQLIESAPNNTPVLITDGEIITGAEFDEYGWSVLGVSGYEWETDIQPTHWMPLPAFPKDVE